MNSLSPHGANHATGVNHRQADCAGAFTSSYRTVLLHAETSLGSARKPAVRPSKIFINSPHGSADILIGVFALCECSRLKWVILPFRSRFLGPTLKFELVFGLEPIIQFTARLPAAFEVDFICAAPDLLVTRRVRCRQLRSLG